MESKRSEARSRNLGYSRHPGLGATTALEDPDLSASGDIRSDGGHHKSRAMT